MYRPPLQPLLLPLGPRLPSPPLNSVSQPPPTSVINKAAEWKCGLSSPRASTFGCLLLLQDLAGPGCGAFGHVDDVLPFHLGSDPAPLGGNFQALLVPVCQGSCWEERHGVNALPDGGLSRVGIDSPELRVPLPASITAHWAINCAQRSGCAGTSEGAGIPRLCGSS